MLLTAWLKSWKSPWVASRRMGGGARRRLRGAESERRTPAQRAEFLEDRMLLTTLVVDTVADVLDGNTNSIPDLLSSPGEDGKISLREAIIAANHGERAPSFFQENDDFNETTITFDPALTAEGDATLFLTMIDTGVVPQLQSLSQPIVESDCPDCGGESHTLEIAAAEFTSVFGPSAFVITSAIRIEGPTGDNGIRIVRANDADEFRLFQIESGGDLTLSNLTLSGGIARGESGATGVGQPIVGSGGGAAGLGGAIFNQGSLKLHNSTISGNVAIGGDGGDGGGCFGCHGAGAGPYGGTAGGGSVYGQGQPGGDGGFASGGGSGRGGTGGGGAGGDGGFGGGGGGGGNKGNGVTGAGGLAGFGGGAGGAGSFLYQGLHGGGGGGAGLGGAVFNHGGVIISSNSTISGNSVQGGAGGGSGLGGVAGSPGSGMAGGLFNLNGTVTLANTTFANNTADGAGAIYNLSHEEAHGIFVNNAEIVLINNVIADSGETNDFVNNQRAGASNATVNATAPNLVESGIVNLDGTVTGSPLTGDPQLNVLADNGGPTATHMPDVGSSAIDAGSNDIYDDLPNPNYFGLPIAGDQRNHDRIVNANVDLGSVEVGGTELPAAELDEFEHALLQVVVDINGELTTLTLDGATSHITLFDGLQLGDALDDGSAPGRDEVATFISGSFFGELANVTLLGFAEGEIEEVVNSTPGRLDLPPFSPTGSANSFFDVFFEVSADGQRFAPAEPVRLQGTVTEKPAGAGEMFLLQGGPIDLFGTPQSVTLQNATSECEMPDHAVDFAIDGIIDPINSPQADGGWSIFCTGTSEPEIAAFETVQTIDFPALLTFRLEQLWGGSHNLGRFRLSVTNDDRSEFADGLNDGGDVTANWVVLDPLTFMSNFGNAGATLTKLEDLSLLASGANPEFDSYTVTALSPITGITGVRIELLEDPSLPDNGPGRAVNGNLVLTEIIVQATPILPVTSITYTPLPLLDYGDAPEEDTLYPTTSLRDGARHVVVGDGPQLGANVDFEVDGQPSLGADGDDTAGTPDDEDGVTLIGTLEVGKTATFQMNAPNGGVLNAWFDYTGDGFWTSGEFETSEQFLFNEVLDPDDADGIYDFQIEVPFFPTIADEATYVRFRINSTGDLEPSGLAADGEVEDYRVEIVSHDFGDAPLSYGTVLDFDESGLDGAYHVRRGPTLGQFSDAELNGPFSGNGTNDDGEGSGDDEDGVFFAPLVTGFVSQVLVTASEDGFLNGWFDFDGDGDFGSYDVNGLFQDDPGEHIFNEVAVNAGLNTLQFTIPASLTAGPTFARFRITSETRTANTPHGLAPDGEVEDYGLIIEGFELPSTDPDVDSNLTDTTFFFQVLQPQRRFYDPAIAIGYDYEVTGGGPNFQSVTLPIVGDNLYTLHLRDPGEFSATPAATLVGGVQYDFTTGLDQDGNSFLPAGIPGGLDGFRILGIETSAGVDPADPMGFLTGLAFVDAGGTFTMTGIPEKVYVDNVADTTIVGGMAGDFAVTTDLGTMGTLDAGDVVTWFGAPAAGDDVTGLIFGTTAFATVQDAVNYVSSNNYQEQTIVRIAAGTFLEHILNPSGVSLAGVGSDLTFLDGNNTGGRVLEIYGDHSVEVSGVTIQNGNVSGNGGGIYNQSQQLTLSNSVVRNNNSTGPGGGIFNDEATLIIVNSTINGNRAIDNAGGIENYFGTLNILNSQIRDNHADDGDGGGIKNRGTMTITDSTISDNTAAGAGGGIANGGDTTITGSTISGNTTSEDGGGIQTDDILTITGSTISDNHSTNRDGGGIYSHAHETISVTDSHIVDNTATNGQGGGIYMLHDVFLITDSDISDNSARDGGGIYQEDSATTITGGTISDNMASEDGGGIYSNGGSDGENDLSITNSTISGNTAGNNGGGIVNDSYYGTATLNVLHSTISGNIADSNGDESGNGGGIFNITEDGTSEVTVFNSTISGNSANSGGGLFNSFSDLTVANSTISGNTAANDGGGIANYGGSLLASNSTITGNRADSDGVDGGEGGGLFADGFDTVNNSIVANNFAGTGTTPNDIEGSGVVEAGGFNLVGDPNSRGGLVNGNNGNIVGQDDGDGGRELLDIHTVLDTTLRDNGGPTLTHRLLFGSPAIDAGSNDLIPPDTFDLDGDEDTEEPVPFDQRGEGFPRDVGGNTVDIGAYEKGPTTSETFSFTLGKLVMEVPDPNNPMTLIPVTVFPEGTAEIAIEYIGTAIGDALDLDEDGLEEVLSEIVSLNLVGMHPELGTIAFPNLNILDVTLDAVHAAIGGAEETVNNTPGTLDVPPHGMAGQVDSFFDVFLTLEFRSTDLTLHQDAPLHIEARLSQLPPEQGEVFVSTGDPVQLLDEENEPAGEIQEFDFTTEALDFGDAPTAEQSGFAASYPTLLADNGARHLRGDGPFLGASIDGDFDGEPMAGADGDDAVDLNDDEDGITFAPLMRVSLVDERSGSVTVNASAEATLDAWIDFNQDGDWDDDGEQIRDDDLIDAGDNNVNFTIPAGALPGTTFARFRLSSNGVALPTGLADDGEVEDHAVTFFPELVEVTVDHGRLSIRDFGGQSNNITVTRDSRTNQFVVSSTANDLTADGITPTNVVRINVADVTGGLHGNLIADLSLGDDRLNLTSVSLHSSVTGGEGNDTLLGGSGNDSLFGEEGNDSVRGNSGNDTVSGGAGTDIVTGDEGTDTQREETDADFVVVNATSIMGVGSTVGESEAFGSGINIVEIIGGESDNFIDASASNRSMILHGGGGDDTLLGGSQADQLLGGNGDDSLNGNGGKDTLNGGDDDDTLTGGTGNDSLDGGDDTNTLVETRNASFTLTDTSLSGNGTDTLANLQIANLTGGTSSNTFTVSGWTGTGTLVGAGGSDTIVAVKDRNSVLSDTRLLTRDDMDLTLNGFAKAKLAGGDGDDSFDIGEWTGSGTLTGGNGDDTVVAERNANYTLTNTSLATVGFGTLSLSGLENAELTGGAGNNTFTVSGWTGDGRLTGGGGIDTLVKSKDSSFELSDEELNTSDGMDLALDGLSVANLTGGASANVFIVSAWHGTGTVNGSSGTDRIEATRDADTTLTNALLTSVVEVSGFNGNGDFGALNLSSIETANLSGGESDNTLNASQFTKGSVTLQGGTGNDVLIGGSKKDSLIGGSGRDLLIGGVGKDSLNGEAGDDILIGGTSTHSGSMTALDAIMAEWTSENSYATRVSNLLNGGGANGTTRLNNTTVQNDSGSADSLTGGANTDWFFRSANDVLDAINGETVTAI